MIFDGEKERRPFDEAFDYVIIGSGAAGATVARTLSDAGASIAVVEEGPAVRTEDFGDTVYPAMRRMFRDMGSIVARGRAFMPIVQGSVLGGSTVMNSAIMWRIPDDVWAPWRDEFGLGDALPLDHLHTNWDRIEEELSIRPVAKDVWGGHNEAMHRAQTALKVAAEPTRRADKGCRGSGRCLTGCPHGAKQSMLVSYLPYATERGATLITSAKVSHVLLDGERAIGVTGFFRDTPKRRKIAPFTIRANKAVIVAASAIQTPGILARSGVRSPHLGRHFQAHPGVPLMAVFPEPINMWFGATQGYDADHHRKDQRFKIETISLPPEIAFVRLPGVGRRWLDNMAEAPHIAIFGVQLRAWAQGTVRDGLLGTDVRFDPEARDMANLKRALRFTAEMYFAAGAKEILTGVHGMPERIRSVDEIDQFLNGPDNPGNYSWILSHLFGTARMSIAPGDGVVGPDFTVHGTDNLYVVDSSVFPTNMGVNPQEAIMGIAMLAAERMRGSVAGA